MRCLKRYGLAALASVGIAGGVPSAVAQTPLPEIVVTAPSPIARRAPTQSAAPAPGPSEQAAPTPAVQQPGTLPIVTDQFATVTVVRNEEIRRNGSSTLGDLLSSK